MPRFRKALAFPIVLAGLLAFVVGTAYGYFVHRNHVFPYLLINPPVPKGSAQHIDPWQSPWFRMHYDVISAFPVRADVVMLGDSLTEAVDWRAMIPGVDVINQGISGDTTVGLLERLDLAKRTGARVIALMIGVNDLQLHQPVDEVFARYDRAIGELAGAGRCIIVQSTLLTRRGAELNRAIDKLNERLAARCVAGQCTYLDLNALLAPGGKLVADATVDGLHLTARGYSLWRDAILPALSACRH